MQIRFSASSMTWRRLQSSPPAPLSTTIQDHLSFDLEERFREVGIPENVIRFSRLSGIDPRDVLALQKFSRDENLLIIVRNPKPSARIWHGVLPPKSVSVKEKSGEAGIASRKGRFVVSDYDLMGVWRCGPKRPEKLFISAANGAARGGWNQEAIRIVRALNRLLVSPFQHGCQDDYHSRSNPGVNLERDHFSVFIAGEMKHKGTVAEIARYYEELGLYWPYDSEGKYIGLTQLP